MNATIATRETFTRYTVTDHTVDAAGVNYLVQWVEVRGSNFGLIDVTAYGQRMRSDGQPDERSSGATRIPLSLHGQNVLVEQLEAATT